MHSILGRKLFKVIILLTWTCFGVSCSKNESNQLATAELWHPSIDKMIMSLQNSNILIFGKAEKADGRYCFLKYEGIARSHKELENLTGVLNQISKTLNDVIISSYAKTALDFTSERKTTNLEDLTQEEKLYLQQKAELSCLRTLIDRQILKYAEKKSDSRISSTR